MLRLSPDICIPSCSRCSCTDRSTWDSRAGVLRQHTKAVDPQIGALRTGPCSVSNHLGKALHRTIREHHSQLFHRFLQLQQTGGRKHVPVQLAQHQLRTFVRAAKRDCQSTGILYLDLTEAFYRVLREMPMGGEIPDHVVAHVASRMRLPQDSLHRLHAMLAQPCALTQAGMPDSDRRAIQAIHTSTHFLGTRTA